MGDTVGTIGRIGAGIGTFGGSEIANAATGGKLYDTISNSYNSLSGSGGGAPAPPDFIALAKETAKQGHVNQTTPFASSQWTPNANGTWSQNISLQGGLSKLPGQLESQIAGLATPMDWSQFGPVSQFGSVGTGEDARNQAITAAYNQAASRLDPQWAQREEALRSQLLNQGLNVQDQAAQSELGNFGRARNDAYNAAMNAAIGQGTEAGSAIFNQNLAGREAEFKNALIARQTAIANALQQRGQPLNERQQLQGLTQGLQAPGSASGANLLGAGGAQYQGALNQYGANQGAKNSTLSGLAALAPLAAAL